MKKQKGMTLVETIVAFSILMVAIALFYGSIQLSNRLIATQNERREQAEETVNAYYLESLYSEYSEKDLGNYPFSDEDKDGLSAGLFQCKKKKLVKTGTGKEIYYYEK